MVLTPWVSAPFRSNEFVRASGWEDVGHKGDRSPSIRTKDAGALILATTTPRPIRRVRMASTAHLPDRSGRMSMDISTDQGRTWTPVAEHKAPPEGAPYDIRPQAVFTDLPVDCTALQFRFRCEGERNGFINLVAEVGYEPAGKRTDVDVKYVWEEYRNGRWVERTHVERAKAPRHRYTITVAGSRPPRMKSVSVQTAGHLKPGYGDRLDNTPQRLPKDYELKLGKDIAKGCPYTVSRPASKAFPDVYDKVLTDGYIGLASYWGLGKINLTGEKNEQRVGQLVVWEPGEAVEITVDLEEARNVGGFAVCAVQPNENVLYPEKMKISVSKDGKAFAPAGELTWEECFFPPANRLIWEGTDSPVYDHLPAGGIIDFTYPLVLDQPVKARFVRFHLAPPTDPKAGIGLWELRVFDRIEKIPFKHRIVLP